MSNEEYIQAAINVLNKYKTNGTWFRRFEFYGYNEDRYSVNFAAKADFYIPSKVAVTSMFSFPLYFIATGCDDKYDKEAKIPASFNKEQKTILRLAYYIWLCLYEKSIQD